MKSSALDLLRQVPKGNLVGGATHLVSALSLPRNQTAGEIFRALIEKTSPPDTSNNDIISPYEIPMLKSENRKLKAQISKAYQDGINDTLAELEIADRARRYKEF